MKKGLRFEMLKKKNAEYIPFLQESRASSCLTLTRLNIIRFSWLIKYWWYTHSLFPDKQNAHMYLMFRTSHLLFHRQLLATVSNIRIARVPRDNLPRNEVEVNWIWRTTKLSVTFHLVWFTSWLIYHSHANRMWECKLR